MNNPVTKGNGRGIQFLRAHVDFDGNDCLIWSMSKTRGYGHFSVNGRLDYAHRMMCELVHGPAPTAEHQAAHSCGRGHEGCVHPKHLSWKTHGDNQLDRAVHGTKNRGTWYHPRLSLDDVNKIRALKDEKTQDELAKMFGTCRRNIGAILSNKTWINISKHHIQR